MLTKAEDEGGPRGPEERRRSSLGSLDAKEIQQFIEREEDDEDVQRALRAVQGVGSSGEQVLRQDLEAHLQGQAERDRKCRNIPFTLLYFLFFDLMLLNHEHFSDTSQVERNIRGMMAGSTYEGYAQGAPGSSRLAVSGHKVLGDVDTVPDVYTFLQEVLIPQLIPGGADAEARRRAYRYHQLIGGLQLEQSRRGRKDCSSLYPAMGPKNEFKVNPLLRGFSCFRAVPNDEVCFGPGAAVEGFCRNASASGGRRLRRVRGFNDDDLSSLNPRMVAFALTSPLYSLTLHESEGTDVALRRLKELMDASWLDEQSEWLGLKFFMLNPDLAVYSITRVNVFFLQTGELLPIVEVTTFMAEPYQYRSVLVVDIVWGLLLMELILSCFWDLFDSLRNRHERFRNYCLNLWTWVGWACAVMGIVVVSLWLVYLDLLEVVKEASLDVTVKRPASMSGSPASPEVMRTYMESVRSLHLHVSDLEAYLAFLRFFLSCYSLLLVARFFEAFHAQPRLAIVTDTMLECLPDFLHFMLVFVTMLMAFSISATFLFGHRLPEFSRVSWSVERCLLMLFGDMDYDRLSAEHPVSALLWSGSFTVLMLLVMLNMCLAVIIDVYSGKKTKFDLSESILAQIWRCSRRNEMPAKQVLKRVEKLDGRMVSGAELAAACPGMSKRQVERLVRVVGEDEDADYDQGTSITDTTRVVVAMKRHVTQVSERVDTLVSSQEKTRARMREMMRRTSAAASPEEPLVLLDPRAKRRLNNVERCLDELEEMLDDALKYTENRGRGLRDGLRNVEERLQSRRTG